MVVFSVGHLLHLRRGDIVAGVAFVAAIAADLVRLAACAPDTMPAAPWLMLLAFIVAALRRGADRFRAVALRRWCSSGPATSLPGEIFAQQMARGIDNFVLLAVPFFILVGYLMEANGMSVRLISLLLRGVGRMRGGLNVVMVLSMVIFSGISGSKMADVAAVGAVLIPAARQVTAEARATPWRCSRPRRSWRRRSRLASI